MAGLLGQVSGTLNCTNGSHGAFTWSEIESSPVAVSGRLTASGVINLPPVTACTVTGTFPCCASVPNPSRLRRRCGAILISAKVRRAGTARQSTVPAPAAFRRGIAASSGNASLREIVIQGRGGQGAQTAGTLLATAFFAEGRYVQSFATYGGARRGTPVSSFIRVDERPIRVRCDVERADAILCFDASLLQGRLLACARPDTPIVVNSSRTREQFASTHAGYRVIPVDGIAIARRHGLGRIVNSALLGAFAAALGAPALDVLARALIEEAPKLHDENVAACEDGYRCVEGALQAVAA